MNIEHFSDEVLPEVGDIVIAAQPYIDITDGDDLFLDSDAIFITTSIAVVTSVDTVCWQCNIMNGAESRTFSYGNLRPLTDLGVYKARLPGTLVQRLDGKRFQTGLFNAYIEEVFINRQRGQHGCWDLEVAYTLKDCNGMVNDTELKYCADEATANLDKLVPQCRDTKVYNGGTILDITRSIMGG